MAGIKSNITYVSQSSPTFSSSTTAVTRRSIFPPSCTSAPKKRPVAATTSFGCDGGDKSSAQSQSPLLTTMATTAAANCADATVSSRKVEFSPYARCLKVESHRDMTDDEKGAIWWTKSDYASFARVSRIISKAMLEGGSEIWLQTSSSSSSSSSMLMSKPSATIDDNSIPTSSSSLSTVTAAAVQLQQQQPNTSNVVTVKKFHETRTQWWHKFGHSRRGLEHVASIGEGRQRRMNVRSSIRAVIEEQERILLMRSNTRNGIHSTSSSSSATQASSEKIRAVYLQHTQWARLLSRAAGSADADAVRTNFDDSKMKSREFYLRVYMGDSSISDADDQNGFGKGEDQQQTINGLSSLMRKVLTIDALKLDANTRSQLSYRRQNLRQQVSVKSSTSPSSLSSSTSSKPVNDLIVTPVKESTNEDLSPSNSNDAHDKYEESLSVATLPTALLEDKEDEKKSDSDDDTVPSLSSTSTTSSTTTSSSALEMVAASPSTSSLAKKAQGYTGSTDESNVKTDMSAVLTGQGIGQMINIIG